MNYKKLVSIVTGIAVLATSFVPGRVSALGQASMTLSGASNTNGNFAVTVYENTGTDTVTTAYVTLDFSSAVSNVSYDYNVGPFKTATPSGAHAAQGEVSGTNAVATVSFTVASPATVTATVSGASFLKHANRDANGNATSVENFVITRGSADFTYSAPAQGGRGGEGTASNNSGAIATTGSTGSTTPVASAGTNSTTAQTETPKTEGVSDTKDSSKQPQTTNSDKKADDKAAANAKGERTVWPWIVLLLIAATAAAYVYRKRTAETPVEEIETPKANKKPAVTPEVVAAPVVAKASTKQNVTTKKPAQNNASRNGKNRGKHSSNKRSR